MISLQNSEKYKRSHTTVTLINYHFVWIPKRRKRVLVGDVAKRLEQLLHQKSEELGCTIIALEIMPDHVHLFLSCPPTLAPDQIMFRLKGYTSKVLREEYLHLKKMPSMWTRSYFCGTAGDASSETIKKYIANQKSQGG